MVTETISKDKCQTVAYECANYQQVSSFLFWRLISLDCYRSLQFKSGKCFPKNGSSTLVGYHVNTLLAEPGRLRFFHAATDSRLPFCVKSFSLNFRLQSTSANHNAKAERGILSAKLYGSLGTSSQVDLTTE